MMREEGGGAAADRPLRSNINSSSSATPLKSLFLSRIGRWASSVVPPLGALLGVRLAETCEKAGPSVGGPHLLQCQRCELVLEPGVSCSIGIDDGKQKHKAVYICNYCGFRNPKASRHKNKNQKSASEEQQQQQSSKKKKKRKWSSLKDIASTSQKGLPKKKMSFEKQEQQLLIENGDSRKAEEVTMNNGGDQSMAIVIVDQEKSQQEVNSSADFKLCALRKVVNMEAGVSEGELTAESGAVHAAEEPVTIEPDDEDDQAAAADLAPEARAVTIVLDDEEKETVVKNAENKPVAEVAEAIQIQATDDVSPEAVVAEPELPQLRASEDREKTQLSAASELLVKEPDQLLASEQNPAELPESPLPALAKNTEMMVESVPVEPQLREPEELPPASLEKEILAEQSEAEGLPASLEAKVLVEQSEPEGLPVSVLPAEQSEPEGLSASAEQSAMTASMEAELPASEDEKKMETVPEDHEKLESVPEDEMSPAEMDCETMKGTSLESDAVPEETEDERVSARKMRSVVRSFLHAKRLQAARFDSRLGAVKRQFKVMGDRCSRGRKKLRRMTKLALSEKDRADNLALQLSGSFKTAKAHIKELKRRVSSLPSLEKQMTKFSTGLTKLSDAIKQLTMEVRKNQAATATGVMAEEAPVVPVVVEDLVTSAAVEDDVKSVGITPAAAADDVKIVASAAAKNPVAGAAENVAKEEFPMTPEAAAGGKEKRAGRSNGLRVSETSKCIRKKPSVQVKIGSVFSSPSSSRCKVVLSKVGRRWKIHTA